MTGWETFTRRTDDPKLAYLERLLTEDGIPHRRNGESGHAPILEVAADRLDDAWAILARPYEAPGPAGRLVPFDDLEDDDSLFQLAEIGGAPYEPHDWP